jgi:hypothetical protein
MSYDLAWDRTRAAGDQPPKLWHDCTVFLLLVQMDEERGKRKGGVPCMSGLHY